MTRNEARMLAEEIYKLIRKDIKLYAEQAVASETEEWMNTEEAAAFLGVSVSYIKKNILDIPHAKIGKLNKFKKSALSQLLNK